MRVKSGVIALALLAVPSFVYVTSNPVVEAQARGTTAAAATAPAFTVDKMWPKPLPNHWILGSITGVSVDSQDHIWLVHRGLESLTARTEAGTGTNPPSAEDCCTPAPPVLEFDAAGSLVSHWGGPGQGYEWPTSPGGIDVDAKGNVWITAAGVPDVPITVARAGGPPAPAAGAGRAAVDEAGNPIPGAARAGAPPAAGRGGGGGGRGRGPAAPPDAHVLKFSRTGQFLLQIGKAGQVGDKTSETSLDHPADVAVDTTANEVYVADGGANQRIVVFDATTGAHKRHWGGHGTDFARVSCVSLSKDGMVYVCDRKNDRIQVFKKDGTFVKEAFVSKTTMLAGSVWDITFSSDPAQRYAFVADGQDEKIFVLDRTTLAVVSSFGDGGGWPGTFRMVDSVGVDSKGNLYTGETFEGKRLQKFIKK